MGLWKRRGWKSNEGEIAEKWLLEALDELAEELERPPTQGEVIKRGEYSVEPYYRAFGSWTDTWEAAGLEPRTTQLGGQIPREDLLMAIEELAAEINGTPTRTELIENGRYSRLPYEREFGSWNEALEAAGFEPNKEYDVSDEHLLDELQSLADESAPTGRNSARRRWSVTTGSAKTVA